MSTDAIYIILAMFGSIFVAFVAKRAGWFKIIGGTNALLREQNQELRNQNELLREKITDMENQHDAETKDWHNKHLENTKEIAKLQGKIDTLTSIPLKKIDESLSTIVETNGKILEHLSASGSSTVVKPSGEVKVTSGTSPQLA